MQPDLVDAGGEPEIVQVLTNVRKPLKLGYVMVKNRSQLQLHEGMSAEEAVRAEDSFFANNDAYRDVPKDLLGADALTRRLTSLLVKRIKHVLPQLKWELQEGLAEVHRVGRTVLSPQPCRDAANQTRDPAPRHLRLSSTAPDRKAESELARLGKDPPETAFEKTQMMLQLFAKYALARGARRPLSQIGIVRTPGG